MTFSCAKLDMTKKERSASWKDVKAVLSRKSPQELLQLMRDLYTLRPEVKAFLHARFLTVADSHSAPNALNTASLGSA